MKTSTKSLAAAVFLAATLALSACTGSTPGTTQASAQYYLDTVCPATTVAAPLDTAKAANDLEAFVAAAGVARDAYKEVATRLSDATVTWPTDVQDDVVVLRDASLVVAATYQSISEVTSFDDAAKISFPGGAAAATAAQEIRKALEIPAGTECP